MVIGVVKDFHFKSIYLKSISPTVLRLEAEGLNYMLVHYSASDRFSGVIEYIKEQWNMLAPDLPFEYITLNNYFQDVYSGDKTPELAGILGVTAIFLSCLGLFGLSSFSVERKIKEIGIRKVFGASVTGIIKMLIKQFIKLVVIANMIAMPIAYYLINGMNQFLYAYPVDIGIDIFIFSLFITLLIAFLTVTSQTLKAAQTNPVESLRYE
jgi:putative ABC transport system permease protein